MIVAKTKYLPAKVDFKIPKRKGFESIARKVAILLARNPDFHIVEILEKGDALARNREWPEHDRIEVMNIAIEIACQNDMQLKEALVLAKTHYVLQEQGINLFDELQNFDKKLGENILVRVIDWLVQKIRGGVKWH